MSLVENLYIDYGNFKIDIPRWEILDSGVTALWGSSGSGKTSVFRALLGLDQAPRMSWNFSGENLARLPVEKRRLGIVFQSYELFPHLSVRENILFAAKARGLSADVAEKEMQFLISKLRMATCLDTKADLISGGEKQRTALARAVIGSPRVLLLDEPFSALDEDIRGEARSMVKELIKEKNIPTILVTHDRRDLAHLADKVSEIQNGKIISGF